MQYLIYNNEDNQHYIIYFHNSEDCYHWIVNTLDLSKDWNFEPYDDFDNMANGVNDNDFQYNIKKERV